MNPTLILLTLILSIVVVSHVRAAGDIAALAADNLAAEQVLEQLENNDRDGSSSEFAAKLERAREHVQRTGDKLEAARIAAIVEDGGLSREVVVAARANGMSWRAIAIEHDIHPSVVGIELIDPSPPPIVLPAP